MSDYTIFVDFDGTLCVHNYKPKEVEDKWLPNAWIKLKHWHDMGYTLVLTTARKEEDVYDFVLEAEESGIHFHSVITDLPVNKRVLINDMKNSEERAFAYNIERDAGIGELDAI